MSHKWTIGRIQQLTNGNNSLSPAERLRESRKPISDLPAENERLRHELIEAQDSAAHWKAEAEAARKVANAAVEYLAAVDSFGKASSGVEYFQRFSPANTNLREAIREYRALTEQLSPGKRAVVEQALEKVAEMEAAR